MINSHFLEHFNIFHNQWSILSKFLQYYLQNNNMDIQHSIYYYIKKIMVHKINNYQHQSHMFYNQYCILNNYHCHHHNNYPRKSKHILHILIFFHHLNMLNIHIMYYLDMSSTMNRRHLQYIYKQLKLKCNQFDNQNIKFIMDQCMLSMQYDRLYKSKI